jgi:hypothetical protein
VKLNPKIDMVWANIYLFILFTYLFIFYLLNDSVSSSGHIMSSNRKISGQYIGNCEEKSGTVSNLPVKSDKTQNLYVRLKANKVCLYLQHVHQSAGNGNKKGILVKPIKTVVQILKHACEKVIVEKEHSLFKLTLIQ